MRIKPPAGCDSFLITNLVNVRYLTGFTGSAGCVLITPRQRLFFTDFRYELQAGRELRDYSLRIASGPSALAAVQYALSRRMRLGVLGLESASLSQQLFARLKKMLKGVKVRDASGTVEEHRVLKDRKQVGAIRRAAAIGDAALKRLARAGVVGRTEIEVAWMLERWMREAGSATLPFEIIVASGKRTALPHGVASKKRIRRNELLIIDLGARVDGYCSDITRTFATGELTSRQRNIYEIVREAQQLALASVRPGARCKMVDGVAREQIAQAGYGKDFGHALGHGVGLEPHEAPVLSSVSRDRLEAGMVVTIEPGIYRQRIGGVRIEDTVVVTGGGPKCLTATSRGLTVLK